jgi:hypothetical protein
MSDENAETRFEASQKQGGGAASDDKRHWSVISLKPYLEPSDWDSNWSLTFNNNSLFYLYVLKDSVSFHCYKAVLCLAAEEIIRVTWYL